jgi:hypothetical protein
VPGCIRETISKVCWPDLTKRKTIAGKIRALPASRYRVNFIAPYSLRVVPQMPMSRYMGNRETSNQTKIKNRSMLIKSPNTPVTSKKYKA